MDPSLEDAYVQLAEIHKESGSAEQARRALVRYLEFMPRSLSVRSLLGER